MPKRLLASVFGFWVLTALGLWSAVAAAQTTGGSIVVNDSPQSTYLSKSDGSAFSHAYTPSTTQLLWVNRNECEQNLTYQISITTAGVQGSLFEVWAAPPSTDCSAQANRTTTPVCWKVFHDTAQNGTYTIPIRAQTIVAQHITGDINAPEFNADKTACDPTGRNIGSGGVQITLYFYIFTGLNSGTPTYSATFAQLGFDLIGPQPPGDVSIGLADTELHLRWSSVLDSDRAGYHIYCQDMGGPDAGVGAGGASTIGGATATGGAANSGGAGGSAGSTQVSDAGTPLDCVAGEVQEGCFPTGMTPQGSASTITSTDAYATGLANEHTYGCAVSVFDVLGNDGPMSKVVYGVPHQVNDVFTAYRKAGGKGGGGFCSIGRPGLPVRQMIPLACLALLALRRRGSGKSHSGDRSR